MNIMKSGRYIAMKRKEKNLTQDQLAERIGVSNKTVSKWETGKNFPDYAIIEYLCKELGITISELLDGEDMQNQANVENAEEQTMKVLERVQQLEKEKGMLTGVMIIFASVAFLAISLCVERGGVRDFWAGFLQGMSIMTMLLGVGLSTYNFFKR